MVTNFQQKRIIANNQDMYNIFNPKNLSGTLKSNVVHYKISSDYFSN